MFIKKSVIAFFLCTVAYCTTLSCGSDDRSPIVEEVQIFGVWKPKYYEYKGKVFNASECKKKGQIQIAAGTNNGNYKNYVQNGTLCTLTEDFDGAWTFNKNSGELKLTYSSNGTQQSKIFIVEDITASTLKIADGSENVDGISGNDDAILVFTK